MNHDENEYLLITSIIFGQKCILEQLLSLYISPRIASMNNCFLVFTHYLFLLYLSSYLNRSEKLSGKATGPHNKKVYETECYRCGMKGHWSRTCRTAKHLVDLYQASMKGKDKQIETNFIDGKNTMDPDDPFFDDDGAVPL